MTETVIIFICGMFAGVLMEFIISAVVIMKGDNNRVICELRALKNKVNNYCDLNGIYDWGMIDLINERIKQLKGDK